MFSCHLLDRCCWAELKGHKLLAAGVLNYHLSLSWKTEFPAFLVLKLVIYRSVTRLLATVKFPSSFHMILKHATICGVYHSPVEICSLARSWGCVRKQECAAVRVDTCGSMSENRQENDKNPICSYHCSSYHGYDSLHMPFCNISHRPLCVFSCVFHTQLQHISSLIAHRHQCQWWCDWLFLCTAQHESTPVIKLCARLKVHRDSESVLDLAETSYDTSVQSVQSALLYFSQYEAATTVISHRLQAVSVCDANESCLSTFPFSLSKQECQWKSLSNWGPSVKQVCAPLAYRFWRPDNLWYQYSLDKP